MAGLADIFNDPKKLESASRFLLNFGQGLVAGNQQGLSPFASIAQGFGAGGAGITALQQERSAKETAALKKKLLEADVRKSEAGERFSRMLLGPQLPPSANLGNVNLPTEDVAALQPANLNDPGTRRQVAGHAAAAGNVSGALDILNQSPYIKVGDKLIDRKTLKPVADFSDPKTNVTTYQDGDDTVTAVIDSATGEVINEVGRGKKSPLVAIDQSGNKLPPPPKDMAYIYNPDGSVKLDERGAPIAVPIQGSKLYEERQQEAAKVEKREEAAQTYADVVTEDIDRAIGVVRDATLPTTGLGGYFLQNVPGTAARDLQGLVDTIRANVGFDKLQQIREASPTGGALGPVSDFENRLMQATIGNLELSQTKEQFLYNMARVKRIYKAIATRGIEPEDLKSGDYGAPPSGDLPAVGQVDGGYIFMGGDPKNPESWYEVR